MDKDYGRVKAHVATSYSLRRAGRDKFLRPGGAGPSHGAETCAGDPASYGFYRSASLSFLF